MAEVVTRVEIVRHLKGIIEEARAGLILISPYIKADEETKDLLEQTTRFIRVLYGKRRLREEEREFLHSRGILTSFLKNLHAKCYLNESRALVTSMNLHEHSLLNNDEIGILVTKQDDEQLYEEIHRQALEWLEEATLDPVIKSEFRAAQKSSVMPAYCIRCATPITAIVTRSGYIRCLCERCYRSWNRYKNPDYREKHCHLCGTLAPTSYGDPVCGDCIKEIEEWDTVFDDFWYPPYMFDL